MRYRKGRCIFASTSWTRSSESWKRAYLPAPPSTPHQRRNINLRWRPGLYLHLCTRWKSHNPPWCGCWFLKVSYATRSSSGILTQPRRESACHHRETTWRNCHTTRPYRIAMEILNRRCSRYWRLRPCWPLTTWCVPQVRRLDRCRRPHIHRLGNLWAT